MALAAAVLAAAAAHTLQRSPGRRAPAPSGWLPALLGRSGGGGGAEAAPPRREHPAPPPSPPRRRGDPLQPGHRPECWDLPPEGLPRLDAPAASRAGARTADVALAEAAPPGLGVPWPSPPPRPRECFVLEAYNFPRQLLGAPRAARVGTLSLVPSEQLGQALWLREAAPLVPGVPGALSLEACDWHGFYVRHDPRSRLLLLLPPPCEAAQAPRATWIRRVPADPSGYFAYEALASPQQFLNHQSTPSPSGVLQVEHAAQEALRPLLALGSPAAHREELARSVRLRAWEDALFRAVPPVSPQQLFGIGPGPPVARWADAGLPEAHPAAPARAPWGRVVRAELRGGLGRRALNYTPPLRELGRVPSAVEVVVVTATYPSPRRLERLCRLAQHFVRDPSLLWLVSDDALRADGAVIELLQRLGVPNWVYFHGIQTNSHGNDQRRVALEFAKRMRLRGVVYNADDDNMYSPLLWPALRGKGRGKWALLPYGLFSPYPGDREGPVGLLPNGTCQGWFPAHYTIGRAYPVDMGGFAFDAELLWELPDPVWQWHSKGGESQFIERLLPQQGDFINLSKSPGRHNYGPFRIPRRWECIPHPNCSAAYPLVVHNNWQHRLNQHTDAASCRAMARRRGR